MERSFTVAASMRANAMEMARSTTLMARSFTMANGARICLMDRGLSTERMKRFFIRARSKEAFTRALEFNGGQMAQSTKAIGEVDKRMEKVPSRVPT